MAEQRLIRLQGRYAVFLHSPLEFVIGVAPLIAGIDFGVLLANKAFDSNRIIKEVNARSATICISQHPQRIKPMHIDAELKLAILTAARKTA